MRLIGGCLLLITVLACNAPTAPTMEGAWGGTQASLVLSRSGGTIQYQCGNGTIDGDWTVSADGTFAGTGEHYFGGGPEPVGGRTPHPAQYTGQVNGSEFTLTVVLTDLSDTLGPFELVRDGPIVTELCL